MARLRTVHLVLVVLVGAYLATTGFGALLFPFEFGQGQLAAYLWPESVMFEAMPSLGSPIYWVILSSLVIIAPLVAVGTELGTRRFVGPLQLPTIPLWVIVLLAAVMAAFCLYKLAMAGALSIHGALDHSLCYRDKILRRVELIGLLGNGFYGLCYSSLPILGCYLLAQAILKRDKSAAAACVVVSSLIIWFDIAIMFKAPAVIYVGTLGLTAWLCGVGLVRSATISFPVAIGLYAGLSIMQFCDTQAKSWDLPRIEAQLSPPANNPHSGNATVQDPIERPSAVFPAETSPASANDKPLTDQIWYMARAALFRIAAGFPYYVQMFSEPGERCGIDLPQWVLKRVCFAPIKVFHAMYPHVNYTTGFQPGPLNVSAYGEAGLGYMLIATIACGALLGFLSSFAGFISPLQVSMAVACCLYAYIATQTSFTGSLVDSYGLVWLLFPIVVLIALMGSAMFCRYMWQRAWS